MWYYVNVKEFLKDVKEEFMFLNEDSIGSKGFFQKTILDTTGLKGTFTIRYLRKKTRIKTSMYNRLKKLEQYADIDCYVTKIEPSNNKERIIQDYKKENKL
jgi:hypothetical protein